MLNLHCLLCLVLAAIVFGLEKTTFLAKSYIFILKCTDGGDGGPPV